MPLMTVSLVSALWATMKVGSSSDIACSALARRSWSARDSGVMLTEMTGAGNSMASRMIGCSSSQIVSPVVVSPRPTAAPMSPQ